MKADDGTELRTLEGVVLDREGQPVGRPQTTVRTFTFRGPIMPILGAAIVLPLAFMAGVAIFGIILAVITAFIILNAIARLFGKSGRVR